MALACLAAGALASCADGDPLDGGAAPGAATTTAPGGDGPATTRPGPPAPTTAPPPSTVPPPVTAPATVEEATVEIVALDPVRAQLRIEGDAPTPCHEPVATVSRSGRTVRVRLATEAPAAGASCAQVLTPFTLRVPLGVFEDGRYDVVLDGETVGQVRA